MTVPTSAPVLSEFHSGGRALPHNVATSVEVLTTFEQIAAVRDQWDRWNWFPETDADFVRIIVETRPEAKTPCVIVLRQDGVIQAMLIGRIEISRLNSLPAWTTPELKVLRVVYAGLLGDWSEENIDTCLRELKQGLSRGDWQAVHFHMLNLQSPWWRRSEKLFAPHSRGPVAAPNAHWTATLPKSYQE